MICHINFEDNKGLMSPFNTQGSVDIFGQGC